MKLVTALLAVSAVFFSSSSATYCTSIIPPVPECEEKSPRDLLFLVDGSQSMNRDRFYGEMLDYCLSLYCAFDPTKSNQAGLIVFNQEITVYVPLAEYTQAQWMAQVETVRATRNSANPACCSCCTPTADAFDAAGEELAIRGKNAISFAFVITDGVPSNNNPSSLPNGGNPAWWFHNPTKGFNPARYNMQIVPQRANVLKQAGHRVFMVGVPNIDNEPPDQFYFNGGYPNGRSICLNRARKEFCWAYNKPPFPLVSLPVDKNSFSTRTWNVTQLIALTVGAVCEILPTPAPTKSPTKRPISTPTSLAPSAHPTMSPTKPTIEQVDLTFLIDRSRSMNWHDAICKKITDTFGPRDSPSKSHCWELFMRYVLAQADDITKIPAGEGGARQLGWAADFPGSSSPAKGLRVNVIGFACTNKQRTPKVFPYSMELAGGPITNRAALEQLLETLRTEVLPGGGTCPGLAIENAVRQIESTKVADYPLQSVILLTDGVFYDMPFPVRATRGLAAYKALRFAVGIAIADSQFTYGLTKAERETQRQQLSAFASAPALFKNLGANGWETLDQVSAVIADEFPAYFFQGSPIPRYTWCGWRRIASCKLDNWRRSHCQWPKKHAKEWGCSKRKKSG